MKHDIVMWVVGSIAAVLLGVMFWSVWYEATFDYTRCNPTEQYRQQHTAAYTTYMKVGDVQVPQFHPAREWTERLYKCPEKNGRGARFDKWRTEDKP